MGSCFNAATAPRPWRTYTPRPYEVRSDAASMRPRHQGRGEPLALQMAYCMQVRACPASGWAGGRQIGANQILDHRLTPVGGYSLATRAGRGPKKMRISSIVKEQRHGDRGS